MTEFLNDVWTFLGALNWAWVVLAIFATAIAIVFGIWIPARLLELHTNQPLIRYVWYVAGTLALVMIYISMYGYGHFWDLYRQSEATEKSAPINSE